MDALLIEILLSYHYTVHDTTHLYDLSLCSLIGLGLWLLHLSPGGSSSGSSWIFGISARTM